jgi:hypothetical protein
MGYSVANAAAPMARSCLWPLRSLRIAGLLSLAFLSLLVAGSCQAKEACPWLNEATAGGFLDGNVRSNVTHTTKNPDDANCEFILRNGPTTVVLRIDVETLAKWPADFASYVARCGQQAEPVKAVGNEAVVCGLDGKKREVSEQVIGRVRDRAFTVGITFNADDNNRDVMREKAKRIAEQVAGFLF